jgi:putative peptidoglycan lipid II flippase
VSRDQSAGGAEARRIPAVALLLAGSVLLSRLLGYVREAVLAYQLGAGAEADAYRAAFQLPDILNYFLAGGALSVAFVPVYTRVRQARGREAAERLLATVLGTMTALAVVATALLWIAAEPLVALQFPRFDPQTRALTVRLTRIVLPAQIFFVAGGIVRAALMAHDRFRTQALAPLLYNAGIIAGGAGFGARFGAEGFAWGALAGAALGPLLVPLLDLRALGQLRVRLRVAPLERDFLRYLAVAAPVMLGLSLLTVDEWYERWFGALLAEGTVAQLAYARQLMLAPVAVVGQAVATAALPALSRLWSEGRREQLDRTLLRTLQAAGGLGVLAAAGAVALAAPAVELVFERGRFGPDDTLRVAALLRVLALAVPAWVLQQVAVRGFYARSDMWRPMLLSTAVALAAVPLYLALGPRFGAEGIAAAGVLGMSANAALTLLLLRRAHGGPALRPLAGGLLRAALVAALAGLAAERAAGVADAALGSLVAGGLAFSAVAIPGLWLAGDEALREVSSRLVRRGRGRG